MIWGRRADSVTAIFVKRWYAMCRTIACHYIPCTIAYDIVHGVAMQVHMLALLWKSHEFPTPVTVIQELDCHLGKHFRGGADKVCSIYWHNYFKVRKTTRSKRGLGYIMFFFFFLCENHRMLLAEKNGDEKTSADICKGLIITWEQSGAEGSDLGARTTGVLAKPLPLINWLWGK